MQVTQIGYTPTEVSKATGASDKLIQDYEMFLSLLTTQLQHQSPLEPLDANKFTEQLVQFSTVEQQVQTNTNMEKMIAALSASNATALVGYVGATIEAEGATTTLKDGQAKWQYTLPDAAKTADVIVRNSAGNIVYQTKLSDLAKGEGTFAWDGKTTTGGTAPDGSYSISISAKSAEGNNVPVTTKISGTVTEVDFSGAEPVLKLGDLSVLLSALKKVKSAGS